MAGNRLDALVAEKVMGWAWWTNTERRMRLILGPREEGWVWWNWNEKIMRPWNGDTDILPFSDWDRGCAMCDPDRPQRLIAEGLPTFSSDPRASESLLEKMRADGWNYRIAASGKSGIAFMCRFAAMTGPAEGKATSDNKFIAIALAALRACGVAESEIQEAMRG